MGYVTGVTDSDFLLSVIVIAVALLALSRLKRLRRLGTRWAGAVPPPEGCAALPRRYIRLAESLALVVSGGMMWFIIAANMQAGRLLQLSSLPHSVAVAQAAAAFCALAVIFAGALVAWRGRSHAGTVIVAVTALAYSLTLNGCGLTCQIFDARRAVAPDTLYVLNVADDLPGAEIWLDDVYLGRTPIRIRASELQRKVPLWSQETDPKKRDLPKPVCAVPAPTDIVHDADLRWSDCQLPIYAMDRNVGVPTANFRSYYARIRLNGEWGESYSSGGGGGDDQFNMTFGARFPQLEARERHLLDQARLADYRPGTEWFRAIETYGPHGWNLVLSSEDAMRQVADEWVARRYALDEVKDASAAWAVFERIGREADAAGTYKTDGIDGRAVNNIAPLIDPERLVRRAEEVIAAGVRSYRVSSAGGLPGFSVQAAHDSDVAPGERSLRPQDGALAHAIWLLNQRLNAEGAAHPNLVQERIVPALLRHDPQGDLELRACMVLGGPDIDRYVSRQDWRKNLEGSRSYFPEGVNLMGVFMNRWAILLANSQTAAGRAFRQSHQSELIAMTNGLLDKTARTGGLNPDLGYLFLDNDLGKDSLAAAYWPRYRERTRAATYTPPILQSQWEYLARMEPLSTVEEYVECWTGTKDSAVWSFNAFPALRSLSQEKYRAVLQALRDVLNSQKKDINTDQSPERFAKGIYTDQSLERIAEELRNSSPTALSRAQFLIQEAQKPENRRTNEFRDWLEGNRAEEGVVKVLATGDAAQGRELACRGILAHPTPANRALLSKLLADPVPEVRTKAEETAKALDQLAKTPAAEFAYPVK